jgi:hypothetical protein
MEIHGRTWEVHARTILDDMLRERSYLLEHSARLKVPNPQQLVLSAWMGAVDKWG